LEVKDVENLANDRLSFFAEKIALAEEGDKSWMLPNDWDEWHDQIRKCY